MNAAEEIRSVSAAARHGRPRSLAGLRRFVKYPSVSGDPLHRPDVENCGRWLARYLQHSGFRDVRATSWGGPPVVTGRMGRRGLPRVLIYGHYDVVPGGAETRWRYPPFSARIVGGRIHGRGTSDDKGQIWAHLAAIRAWHTAGRDLPVEVVLLIEGEEEIGSPNITPAIDDLATRGGADVAIVSDTRMISTGQPTIITSLRGSAVLDVQVITPGRELHSGAFGGAVVNPIQVLAEAVASVHDGDGRIVVPRFHRSDRPSTPGFRRTVRRLGLSDAALARAAGGALLIGDPRYSAFERSTLQPAIVTTAIAGGSLGPGARNSIPSTARARVNIRLAPGQNPREAVLQVTRHLQLAVPDGVRMVISAGRASSSFAAQIGHPAISLVASALASSYGRATAFLPSGGSIPAVPILARRLGVPVILMGFAQPGDRIHAPNESFSLVGLHRATDACIRVFQTLGGLPATSLEPIGRQP